MGNRNSSCHGNPDTLEGSRLTAAANGQRRDSLVNRYDVSGITPLHRACEAGDLHQVLRLMAKGANVNLATSSAHGHATPLIFAAANGHEKCVGALLAAGSAPDAADDWQNTAVFQAACYNHTKCVQLLLCYDADPNKANRWNALPLQYAAIQGHTRVVDVLLENGADVTLRGEPGVRSALKSILEGATRHGHVDWVEILLKAGAVSGWLNENNNGESMLYTVFNHILQNYPQQSDVRSCTAVDRLLTIAERLIENGSTIDISIISLIANRLRELDSNGVALKCAKLTLRYLPYSDHHYPGLAKMFQVLVLDGTPAAIAIMTRMMEIGFRLSRTDLEGFVSTTDSSTRRSEAEQLMRLMSQPSPLLLLCRQTIRSSLNGNAVTHAYVEQLTLPNILKDYVAT